MKHMATKKKESYWHPMIESLEQDLASIGLPHEDAATHRHIADLQQWISKCRNERMQDKLSVGHSATLRDLRDHLSLTVSESQQLTNEGGIPASKEQTQKTERLIKVMRHIDQILEHGA